MKLGNASVILRAPEPVDVDILYEWENDPRLWECGDTDMPLSRALIEQFVIGSAGSIAETRQARLMIVDATDGMAAGTVDLFKVDFINSRAGIGIFVAENRRRHHLALNALAVVEAYCRRHLGLESLWALIAADNEASCRLFAAAGYERAGLLRRWLRKRRDAVVVQRFLGD